MNQDNKVVSSTSNNIKELSPNVLLQISRPEDLQGHTTFIHQAC